MFASGCTVVCIEDGLGDAVLFMTARRTSSAAL
jgi:hypothetical protein